MDTTYDMTLTNDLSIDFLFSFTQLGWILPTTSASISFTFSILVIAFISRSRESNDLLSDPYHRIMLFMGSWDVVSSLAMALTTVAMPSDVHDIYPFAGGAFGNILTCTLQGLAICIGSLYTVWSNVALNIYYVCTIRYGISAETMNKRILPFMLGASTLQVCILSYVSLSLDLINPRPFEPYCLVGPYPHDCLEKEGVECIRGHISESTEQAVIKVFICTIGLSFFCIVTSLVLVVEAVFKMETHSRTRRTNTNQNVSHTNTRIALRQALMYIAAFLLTWIWLGISILMDGDTKRITIVTPFKLVFQPLQGFFNGAIFLSNKVSILRKADPSLTMYAAIRQTIISPSRVPQILISQMSAVGGEAEPEAAEVDDWEISYERPSSSVPSGVSIPSNRTPSFVLSRAISSSSSKERISVSGGEKLVRKKNGVGRNLNESESDSNASRLSANLRQVIQPSSRKTRQMTSFSSQRDIGDDPHAHAGDDSSSEISDESSISYVAVRFQRRGKLSSNEALK